MIERYVFVKLKDPYADPAGRAAVASETRRRIEGLPGVLALRVGRPADAHAEAAWDLSIAVRFADLEGVGATLDHPDHRAYVDEFLLPRTKVLKAWNFDLE